jgi:8-oxo-dGTP pyrophosphatase MutT (NUDIX family)
MPQHPLVVDKNREQYDVYIGRKHSAYWQNRHYGNPFSHKIFPGVVLVFETVEEAVQAFRDWLDGVAWQDVEEVRRLWILNHLKELRGKRLGCFGCEPVCHGDVLAEKANV